MSLLVPVVKESADITPGSKGNTHQAKQKDVKIVEEEKQELPVTDYKVEHGEDYTVEYCKELERNYWRNLTFVPPMYGADMSGKSAIFIIYIMEYNKDNDGEAMTG
jgi:hypothetical protein